MYRTVFCFLSLFSLVLFLLFVLAFGVFCLVVFFFIFFTVCFCFYYFSWVLIAWFLFCLVDLLLLFVLFCFLSHHLICRILVPWPGIGSEWAPSPENSLTQGIPSVSMSSPRDPHLSTKTWLHLIVCKLQCWMPQAKQPAWQEHSPIHWQTGCQKSY